MSNYYSQATPEERAAIDAAIERLEHLFKLRALNSWAKLDSPGTEFRQRSMDDAKSADRAEPNITPCDCYACRWSAVAIAAIEAEELGSAFAMAAVIQ